MNTSAKRELAGRLVAYISTYRDRYPYHLTEVRHERDRTTFRANCCMQTRSVGISCIELRTHKTAIGIAPDSTWRVKRINCACDEACCVASADFVLQVGMWMTVARSFPGIFRHERIKRGYLMRQFSDGDACGICQEMWLKSHDHRKCKAAADEFCTLAYALWGLQGAICDDVLGHIKRACVLNLSVWSCV